MCGIIGVISDKFDPKTDSQAFDRMMIMNESRGKHSSGVFSVDDEGGVALHKEAVIGHRYIHHPDYQAIAHNQDSTKVLIGHCRHATVGAVTAGNAHPFNHKHITGVHNGSLIKNTKILLEKPYGETLDTDSEALYRFISDYGFEEAIKLMSHPDDSYQGKGGWGDDAFTLVWWDGKERSLNLVRNVCRPLVFAPHNGGIVIASEASFIHAGYGLDIEVRSMKPHVLYSFKYDEKGESNLSKPTETDYTKIMSPSKKVHQYHRPPPAATTNTAKNNGGPSSSSSHPFLSSRKQQSLTKQSTRNSHSNSNRPHRSRFFSSIVDNCQVPHVELRVLAPDCLDWGSPDSLIKGLSSAIAELSETIAALKSRSRPDELEGMSLKDVEHDLLQLVNLRGTLQSFAELRTEKGPIYTYQYFDCREVIQELVSSPHYSCPAGLEIYDYADVCELIDQIPSTPGCCSWCGFQLKPHIGDPLLVINHVSEDIVCPNCTEETIVNGVSKQELVEYARQLGSAYDIDSPKTKALAMYSLLEQIYDSPDNTTANPEATTH